MATFVTSINSSSSSTPSGSLFETAKLRHVYLFLHACTHGKRERFSWMRTRRTRVRRRDDSLLLFLALLSSCDIEGGNYGLSIKPFSPY